MKLPAMVLGVVFCAAGGAHAQFHSCPQPDGRTVFQQLPCDPPAAPQAAAANPAPAAAVAPAPAAKPAPARAARSAKARDDEPPRPTRRKREVLELSAQFERCRADAPGFAEMSADIYAAWRRRHAAVLGEYDRLLAAKVRAARRSDTYLPVHLCTAEWLAGIEPLSRMPDARFATVEKTWQVFMGALMTGDRETALSCLAGRAGVRWKVRVEQLSDEDLRRIAGSIRALKVQWGDDYEKEAIVADTENRAVGVAFRNLNDEWKITDWGGAPVPVLTP